MKTRVAQSTRLGFSIVVLALTVLFFGTLPARAADPFQITIFHINDTHSHLEGAPLTLKLGGEKTYVQAGGFARLAALLEAEAKKGGNLLRLHAGDAFQGTLYFTKYQGAADADMLNLLKIDAMALGNHEFDLGPAALGKFIDRVSFPVLSANTDASKEPTLVGKVAPYAIIETGGRKIGVIGLITPRTPTISSPGDTVAFADPVEAAQRAVNELTAKSVNITIVLSHLGVEADVALARSVPGIDLIVGGHSHTLIGDFGDVGLQSDGDYPIVIQGPDGKVPIVQAWQWSMVAGLLDAWFDDDGRLVRWSGRPVLVLAQNFERKNDAGDEVPVDEAARAAILADVERNPGLAVMPEAEAVTAKLAEYKKVLAAMETEVVARVAEDLPHVRRPGDVHEATGAKLEHGSRVAPIVAEAMLWKLRSLGQNAAAYIANAGGVRTDLEAGDLTVGGVYRLLPFGNTIVTIELTGAEIRQALETGYAGQGSGAIPYAAGLQYQVDPARPTGQRIVDVQLVGPDGGLVPLDPTAKYLVAVNSFLASGGDGYEVLAQAPGARYDTGFLEAEIFMEYARMKGTITAPASTGVTRLP